MNTFFRVILLLVCPIHLCAQSIEKLITAAEVERIEKTLSSDDMRGRLAGSEGSAKAADFIALEFKAVGLSFPEGSQEFKQSFSMVKPDLTGASGKYGALSLSPATVNAITSSPELQITPGSGFEKAYIKKGSSLLREANGFAQSGKNYLVVVDTSFTSVFNRLSALKRSIFKSDKSVIFVLSQEDASAYDIRLSHAITPISLANVVGVIPGKGRKNEYVIFSGHYDHLGTGKSVKGDSIYNGANDDAAGTTAVIALAKYFKALGNNERTIVFAAFTAEESGGFGSQYFSTRFDPKQVAAMFNIEMIGTDSKWGKNSAYITGYDKTDMGKILEKNLAGTAFKFYPDPYPDQQLFYRSDNATLARQGVPAHTISTSKMDSEKFYHTVDDEIGTLDLANMTKIIQAIALSSKSIIAGMDAPTRVERY